MESTPQKLEKNSQHAQVCGFVLKKKKKKSTSVKQQDGYYLLLYIPFQHYLSTYFFGCAGSCCREGFAIAAASRGYSSWCSGLSPRWLLSVQGTSSRNAGFTRCKVWARSCGDGLGCSMAPGIFPDQGLNPCLPHWQADSLPLSQQGTPILYISPSLKRTS